MIKIGLLVCLSISLLSETQSRVISNDFDAQDISPAIQMTKKKVETAPLDVNDNVNHVLELVSGLVQILGDSVGGLTYDLTGISIHDCSGNFKDKNISELTCDEFLDYLSECESLGHIKPLLKSAKARHQKIKVKAGSTNPCRTE